MTESSYWDRVVRRLKEIEKDWMPPRPTTGIQTSTSVPFLRSGIISVANSSVWGGGVFGASASYLSAVYGHRVTNVTSAINDSFPAAFGEIVRRLGGISIDDITDVLRNMLRDVAIILGGSTVLGAGIGSAVGALAFGVGAIPGAGIGATAGFEMGNLILTLTGLKSVAGFMASAVPPAIRCYGKGFKDAWGERNDVNTPPWAKFAYKEFAEGHVLFVMAILMGIVGYLMRGKGNFPILMGEIRASAKLVPKFADWITVNQESLMRNPALQQGIKASAGGSAAESEAASVLPQGPTRGQTLQNVVNPDARPTAISPVTPSSAATEGESPLSATQLRSTPGVASVSSELSPASGQWLDPSTPTPIPKQVGDALAGRTFNSFDDLRSAIWEQIGNNPELNSSFSRANLAQLRAGNAPFAPSEYLADSGAFGDRFNLHHVDPIADGGSVYDLSNLEIVSPQTHFDIHYGP